MPRLPNSVWPCKPFSFWCGFYSDRLRQPAVGAGQSKLSLCPQGCWQRLAGCSSTAPATVAAHGTFST